MGGLQRGLYEPLITAGLDAELADADPDLISTAPLDPADAFETLTVHLAQLSRAALTSVTGDDASRLHKQIEVANRIAAAIRDAVPGATSPTDEVHEPGMLLREVMVRDGLPGGGGKVSTSTW